MVTKPKPQKVDYSVLSREEIEARLRLAEDVVLMYSWSPARLGTDVTDREKAAYILWRRWYHAVGQDSSPHRNAHLNDDVVAQLADDRDEEIRRVGIRAS